MTAADIRLFLAGYVLSTLLCAIMMASLWWQNKKRSPEIIFWLANFIMQFTGVLLLAFRDILPDFLTIVVANMLIIGGTIVLYIGLCRYTGKECRQLHNYLMLAVFTLAHLFLTYAYPNFNLRAVNMSMAFIFICAQCAWLLLRKVKPDLRLVTKVTGVIFSLLCLLSLFQIAVSLIKPRINDFLLSGFYGIFAILTYQMAFIALSMALFLMVSRRLSLSLEREIIQREREEKLIRLRLSLLEFAATHSLEEVLQQTLDEVGTLIDSPIGFYHFVENDQKTLSLQAWLTRTLKEFCKTKSKGLHYGIDQAGVWVDCVHEKQTVIHNDYNSLPHRKGMPEGHASVIRELVVPIMRGGLVVAILGVGNKPVDYTEKDAEIVAYLADVAWEIALRKRAEENLRESEAFRKRVFESSRIPIIIMDVVTSKYIDCNPAATEIYGFSSREETLGKTPLDVSTPVQYDNTPSSEKALFYIEKGLADGKVVFEWRHRRPDGKIWDAEVHLMSFQSGERHFIQFTLQDITERKRVEAELLHIKKAVESSSDAIGLSDPQGRHIYQNKAFTKLFEYTLAEISAAGGGPAVYADKDIAGKVFEAIMSGKSWSGDVEMISRSGRKFPAALHADAIKDESGQIVGLIGVHTDITERKQAESQRVASIEALRKSEERFKQLAEVFPETIFEADMKGDVTYANEHGLKHFGLTEEDIAKGVNIFDLVSPDHRNLAKERIQNRIQGTSKGYLEYQAMKKDGSTFYALALSVPIIIDGAPVGIRGFILDITERKRAEEALKQNEVFLNTLLNSIPIPVFYKDRDGRYTGFNKAYEKFFGATKEQLVGKTVFDISPPDLAKIYYDKDNELFESGNEQHYETQVKNMLGITRDVIFNKAVFTDSHGSIIGLIGAILDITERKRAEAALKESEEGLHAITNSANDAIIMIDNNGNISYWNPAAKHILGYTSAEAIGNNLHELITPERFLPAHLAAFPEFQKTGKGNAIGKTLELAARRKDGREIDVALSLSAVNIKGMWNAVGIIQDITERKHAEEALRESEERYHFIADHTADHIWTMDMSMHYLYSSPVVFNLLGYTIEELMKLEIDQFFTPESLALARQVLMEELETDKNPNADPNRIFMLQSAHYHRDGHLVWLESSLTFIRDESMKPVGILGVSRDITERKKAEEHIQYLATHDSLTDLPSLRLAKDRLTMAMNRARRNKTSMAVMFIDLDGFKTVNDTLGHDAGDYVLRQVARRMLSCVRETDTVARVGGDEFLIIAAEISTPENAMQIAEKIIQTVSRQIIFNEQRAVVGTSIGIALFPDHGEDMDKLIKQADEAMYRVKNSGKNGFRFVNTP